jgi:hypothetical protein
VNLCHMLEMFFACSAYQPLPDFAVKNWVRDCPLHVRT